MEVSDRAWASLAFSVPLGLWLIASVVGQPGVTTGSGLGWFFDYLTPGASGWTVWLRDNLFEVLALTLLALIAWRLYRDRPV